MLTFAIILLLPSSLTFITLLIHRIRAARAAQRERAPEDIVRSLPWRVYTETGWEKHDGIVPGQNSEGLSENRDVESATLPANMEASSTSREANRALQQPWFETQVECAICLSEFVVGDRVRVLPCQHIFHLDEVDEWLIQRKKLVGCISDSQ